MRFGKVLLGLVTLASLHISRGQCTNGLAGVQSGGICCAESCGVCGGSGCGQLDGGRENCCTGVITESGDMCSDTGAAPCIIDDDVFCSNGVVGIQEDDICCAAECGRCGGSGCGQLPGGPENCCTRAIRLTGVLCSTNMMMAPCIVDDAVMCSNGLTGVDRNDICCEAQCGICGGSGCAGRDGGPEACCLSTITDSGVLCSESGAAPCIMGP